MSLSQGANMTAGSSNPGTFALPGNFTSDLSLDNTFGAYLIGTFISLPLYGLSIHQLYRYCRLFPKDTAYIRILLITVMSLETVHVVMGIHSCYYYLTTNYDRPEVLLGNLVWSAMDLPLVSTIVAFVSEIFFARRVALLGSAHRIIAILAIVCLLLQIGFTSAFIGKTYQDGSFLGRSSVLSWVAPAGYGCAALADILLSGCIIRALRHSRADYPRDDSLLDVFMLYVVNTGALTGLCNLIAFVLAVASPDEIRWTAFNAIACRLAANTLLSVLNSRKLLISRGMEILDGKSLGRNIIARANELAVAERWNVPQVPHHSTSPIRVDVKTETETDSSGGRRSASESEAHSHSSMDLKGKFMEDV